MNIYYEIEDEKGILHQDQPPDAIATKIFNYVAQLSYETAYLTRLMDATYVGTIHYPAHSNRDITYLYCKDNLFYRLEKTKSEKGLRGMQDIVSHPNAVAVSTNYL